jgi:hypothetical protein
MSDFLNVDALRAENELDALLSSAITSSVPTRWERKNLKTKESSAANSASSDRFIPARFVLTF